MATVNVNRGLVDQFYRYKMPKIIAKVEGKGNGIKTVLVNIQDVAKALNRPSMYPTKYFGCVLGAQVQFEAKNDRYIVNGCHDANKLQDLLDGFIQKYILCPSCENPETVLGVKKQTITTVCKACGYSGTLNVADKLAAYILKYPPQSDADQTKLGNSVVSNSAKKAKDKKEKKEKKAAKNGHTETGNPHADDGGVGGSDEDARDGFTNGGGHSNGSPAHQGDSPDEGNDDDEDWGEDDPVLDVVDCGRPELTDGIKKLTVNEDLDKKESERLAIHFDFVKRRLEKIGDFATQKEIVTEADRLDVRDKAIINLCDLLLTERMVTELKIHRILFLRFTAENRKAQRYFLRGVEMTIEKYERDLLPKVLIVFKTLYDEDLVEEKAFLQWAAKRATKVDAPLADKIHAKAKDFIDWLQNAESEESDEDGEDDEEGDDDGDGPKIEINFDDRVVGAAKVETIVPKGSPTLVSVAATTASVKAAVPVVEDINIDDI